MAVVVGASDEFTPDRPGPPDAMPWPIATPGPPDGLTEADLRSIRDQVWDMAAGGSVTSPVQSAGIGATADGILVVKLDLRADAVDVAREVWARFGPNVEIALGYRLYPSGETTDEARCPPAPGPDAEAPGLEAKLWLHGGGRVRQGEDFTGTVVMRNPTDADVIVMTNVQGVVVEQGTRSVVGITTRPRRLVARVETIPAGGDREVDVAFGTTACRAGGPPGIGPGRYAALVALPVWGRAGAGATGEFVVGEAELVVE